MSGLFYILISPILLLISIPLTILAAFTTTLSFSTLFLRVLIVYAELAAALIQDHFADSRSPASSKRASPYPKPTLDDSRSVARRKSRRSSGTSGSSNGSTTPKAPKTSGLGIYGGEGAARDFEGVGGWRIPGHESEDELWTSMNSRLELPAMMGGDERIHQRSRTLGNLHNYQYYSRSLGTSRAWTPQQHSPSPGEFFSTNRPPSKSTTALDTANIGKALLRTRQSSSSSGSSQGSNRTLQLTLSNT